MQRAFGKEYDLGYGQGWYNAEEDWKLKVKEKIDYLKSLEFGSDLVTQSTANLTTICILQGLLED
jgi:hypothetical protein